MSSIDAATFARRIVAMFSIRESPRFRTPARNQVFAISGEPSAALVTPVTEMPRSPNLETRVRAL